MLLVWVKATIAPTVFRNLMHEEWMLPCSLGLISAELYALNDVIGKQFGTALVRAHQRELLLASILGG
jgi:hypothetical protein